MNQSTTKTTNLNLAKKILAVMAEVSGIEKDSRNTAQNYDYVSEANLVKAVRAALIKNKLIIIPDMKSETLEQIYEESKKRTLYVARVVMNYTIIDTESGENETICFAGWGLDYGGEKGIYKAFTGSNKYFLMKLFQIPTGVDPESEAGNAGGGSQGSGQSAGGGGQQRQQGGNKPAGGAPSQAPKPMTGGQESLIRRLINERDFENDAAFEYKAKVMKWIDNGKPKMSNDASKVIDNLQKFPKRKPKPADPPPDYDEDPAEQFDQMTRRQNKTGKTVAEDPDQRPDDQEDLPF